MADPEPIARWFDREADACIRAGGGDEAGVAGISGVLLEEVEAAGLTGRSVLDLGCGMGGLAIEAARRGAARVHGVDVSPASIEVARARVRHTGLDDRVTFEVGDASSGTFGTHDVVILNKSICCYPAGPRLVDASAPLAGSVYAFSVPSSGGVRGLLSRVALGFENTWRRVRGDPFRAFVHDVDDLEGRAAARGFRRRRRLDRGMWHVAVFVRST